MHKTKIEAEFKRIEIEIEIEIRPDKRFVAIAMMMKKCNFAILCLRNIVVVF